MNIWRNIPRADGYSPAQLLFGRRQFTSLPAMACAYDFYDIKAAQASRDKVFNLHLTHHNQNTGFLPDFLPGDCVVIQDSKSGDWNQRGVILSIRRSGQSYDVSSDGRTLIQSRRFSDEFLILWLFLQFVVVYVFLRLRSARNRHGRRQF